MAPRAMGARHGPRTSWLIVPVVRPRLLWAHHTCGPTSASALRASVEVGRTSTGTQNLGRAGAGPSEHKHMRKEPSLGQAQAQLGCREPRLGQARLQRTSARTSTGPTSTREPSSARTRREHPNEHKKTKLYIIEIKRREWESNLLSHPHPNNTPTTKPNSLINIYV